MSEKINAYESAPTWRKTAGYLLAGLAIGAGGMDIASQIMEFPLVPRTVLDSSVGALGAVIGEEASRKRSRASVFESRSDSPKPANEIAARRQTTGENE